MEFDDNIMPPWQSEHLLQHMFALAKESPRQDHVLPVLKRAIEARINKSRYTRKSKSLTAQDVKGAIFEIHQRKEEERVEALRRMIKEEEEAEDESVPSSEASEAASSEGIAPSTANDALVAPPPRKWARTDNIDEKSTVELILRIVLAAITSAVAQEQAEDDELARRRSHLKGKWPEKATDKNLNAVEIAVQSLTSENGEKISPKSMMDWLTLFQEHLKLQLSSFSEQQWDDWIDNGSESGQE